MLSYSSFPTTCIYHVSNFLQNSPLFQYLHDLGHTDFEACPTASQEEEYIDQVGDLSTPDDNPQRALVSFLGKYLVAGALPKPASLRQKTEKWDHPFVGPQEAL